MKILFINTVSHYGSTGKIVDNLIKVAQSRGHHTFSIFGRGNSYSKIEFKNQSTIGFYLHVMFTRLFDLHGLLSLIPSYKTIYKIKKNKPDVINIHNLHGYYINYVILFHFLKKIKIPIVWTLHDCWSFTGHCTHFDYIKCSKWKNQCNLCPSKKDYPASYIFDFSQNNYRIKKNTFTSIKNITFITPSDWLKKLVQSSFFKNYYIKTINNGIDLFQDFKYIPGVKDDKIVLAVASPWTKRKGYNDLNYIAKKLKDYCTFVIIGLSEKQITELPNYCNKIKRTNNLQELSLWYNKATVFINPTYEDNFPTTNLEALASGTPVITYDTGGSSEAIDSSTGIIVKQGDLESLTDTVISVLNKDIVFDSSVCRKRAEEHYDRYLKFNEYIDLFETLI